MEAKDIANYIDQYLRVPEIKDASLNGLQVQGKTEITKIGYAVDACVESFQKAKEQGVDFLMVHHGLFWGQEQAIVGSHYARVRLLIESGMNLYCAHLPLDAHPEVGNNAQLAKALDLSVEHYFGEYRGTPIAVYARSDTKITAEQLLARLKKVVGDHARLDAFGPKKFRNIGICSGSGTSLLPEAKRMNLDAFITGETRQNFYHFTQEEGIHALYGRHYDTEIIGLKALAAHLEEIFELPTVFLDAPTRI